MSIGGVLALLVLIAAFVLYLISKLDPTDAALFAALAVAILLSAWPIVWKRVA